MRHSALLAVVLLWPLSCLAVESEFERAGTTLATGTASSDLSLLNGVSVRVSPRSSGTVYDDHLVVEGGSVQVGNFSGYTVDAKELHIQAQAPAARAVVSVSNDRVEVASLGGDVSVSEDGAVLARVVSGTHVAFQRQDAHVSLKRRDQSGNHHHDRHLLLWIIVGTAAAALAIGITAAVQGKSL